MKRVNVPALLYVLSASSVIIVAFWTRSSLSISRETRRLWGMFVFLLGMTLFTWAGLCLKGAFFGNVEPATGELITNGPYNLVRHPLYLGTAISLTGLCLSLRSLWGIQSVLFLFLPALIHAHSDPPLSCPPFRCPMSLAALGGRTGAPGRPIPERQD